METRYLNTLIASVEAGTFSRAAELLHITQSAVSQRIKFLEEHFGQQLLDRSGQRLALTPSGKIVFDKARDILDKEKELLNCLQDSAAQKRLSLCCTPTFGMAYMPQVLSAFLRVHSDLSDLKFIFLQPEEALRGLRDEEFDLAVIEHRLDLDFTGFDRFSMPDDEMLVVSSASAALSNVDGVVQLADLENVRLFARRDGCSSKELLRKNLVACGFDFSNFDGIIVSDDLHFTIQSVLEGDGIAYLSRALVSSYLASGKLVGLRVAGFEHRRGRSVAILPQRSDDVLLKELLEILFEVVSPFWRPQLVNDA
ncbi:MAG: LysR family transcriptional regulator [Desulfuromonadales bacterium]|nr:LysR family transcriptional regulator [Desulfuromonadales bacterium]